ncbi:MAG: flavin reductase family protein [Planctomycetota bacterium]|nr:flavin reductase family protein [Planctomycetota bacterium]
MQKRTTPSEALLRKYPEQVVLVTTRSADGRPNVMAVGWVAIASSDPPMFVLGIDDGAYTYELITRTKEFVVAFPSERMARETLFAGSHSGRDKDKFAEAGIGAEPAALVKAPLVADAVANFECVLVEISRPGDCPLVMGKVVAAHAHEDTSLRRLYTTAKGHTLGGVRAAAGGE